MPQEAVVTTPVIKSTEGITIPIPPPAPIVLETKFTTADIEHARQQEKEKVYATIETWEQKFAEQGAKLADILKDKAAEVKSAADTATATAEAAAKTRWEESDAKTQVADMRTEFEAKLAEIERQRGMERETFAKERTFNELKDYAQAKVSEALAANSIAPELVGYISGNNTAEIDASLVRATATTESLLASIAAATATQQTAPRGVSPTGYAPVGPMDANSSQQTYSAQDIKDMSIQEYASKRGSFLGAAANSARDRGMFG